MTFHPETNQWNYRSKSRTPVWSKEVRILKLTLQLCYMTIRENVGSFLSVNCRKLKVFAIQIKFPGSDHLTVSES